jgi:hypothetical protein
MLDESEPLKPDLSQLLVGLQEEFRWGTRAEGFRPLEDWHRPRSKSSFRHVVGWPAGPSVVVKIVEGWQADDAETMFLAMTDLADTLDRASIAKAHAIRPLAWASHPPLIVMPYVAGSDVVSVLRQPDHEAWNGNLDTWVHKAGEMLAIYHSVHRGGPERDPQEEARRLAARFRIDQGRIERLLTAIDLPLRSAASYGDIGPGNLHAASSGEVYLLDPPVDPTTSLIHRDLGNFVFELRRQLAGRGYTSTPPIEGQFSRLRTEFIMGYSERSHGGPIEAADLGLVALFELRRAAGMVRRRLPRRPLDAYWFGRSALRRRAEVVRATVSQQP